MMGAPIADLARRARAQLAAALDPTEGTTPPQAEAVQAAYGAWARGMVAGGPGLRDDADGASPELRDAFLAAAVMDLLTRVLLPRQGQGDGFAWVPACLDDGLRGELAALREEAPLLHPDQDLLGELYEGLLSAPGRGGGPSYRRRLGQFYTPKPLVGLMWALTRDLLRRRAGRDLVDEGRAPLRIIDPCCGSGTFLSEAIRQARDGTAGQGLARFAEGLVGVDLNPQGLGLAEINLRLALGTDAPDAALDLRCADGLSLVEGRAPAPAWADVVISNPPYGEAAMPPARRRELLPFAYAPFHHDAQGRLLEPLADRGPGRSTVPPGERNRGKIKDLFAFFFGLADRLLVEGGVLAFLSAKSWLTIPSYRYFRRYLLQRYTLDTIVDFNPTSDRVSVFAPDAGIATAIVLMQKRPPPPGHAIRFLDLSQVKTVRGKYEAFLTARWTGKARDRRDLAAWQLKPIADLAFVHAPQAAYLDRPDLELRPPSPDPLLDQLEQDTTRLSEQHRTWQGVDVGDLRQLVDGDPEVLRRRIEAQVFTGRLEGFTSTARQGISRALAEGRIDRRWDPDKLMPFAFQKDLRRWSQPPLRWVYMDHHILWRSRLQQGGKPSDAVHAAQKLLVVERRERGELVALVTRQACAPQHGGRFYYLVQGPGLEGVDLHTLCALLNSGPIGRYHRSRGQGNKDVRLRPLARIAPAQRRALAEHSVALHALDDRGAAAAAERADHLAAIDALVCEIYGIPAENGRRTA